MEWLIILALLGWVWRQSYRIGKLERRLGALDAEARARAATAMPPPVAEPQPPKPEAPPAPVVLDTPPPAPEPVKPALTLVTPPTPAEQEPLILDKPLPPDTREPLLLDQPLPPEDQTPLVIPAAAHPAPITRAPAPKPPKEKGERRFEKWLAENGFAWAGGSLVAFGIIFFLSYASQQGWFTPQLRLLLATVFGAVLIGASEYARRIGLKTPPGHPLVASMLAGAGVVAFYGTVLAALGYGFINYSVAATLLTVCALILLALSFLHGQALGVLAIGAALLAPALSNLGAWPSWAATLYIAAVSIGAFAVAWLKRWSWVAVTAVSGLYLWFASALTFNEVRRALALLSIASLGAFFVGTRPPLKDETGKRLPWSRAQGLGPTIAMCISSVLLIWVWLALAPAPAGTIAGPALIAIFHVALASVAVRARVAAPAALAVSIGALVFGFLAYLRARFYFPPLGWDYYPSILFASLVVAVAALGSRPHRTSRTLIAASGAIGSALLVTLAAFSRENAWHSVQAWGPLFIGAALLFAAAWHTSRDVAEPKTDNAVTFWAGAGAALVLIGVESVSRQPEWRAALHALAALFFSIGFAWRGWRILGQASLTAAAITIAHSLSVSLLGAAITGTLPIQSALMILIAAAAFLYGASTFAMQRGHTSATVESLSTASIIVMLIALFLGLRWIAMGGAGTPLDVFTESSLRALTLLAAGHVTMTKPSEAAGVIARWRGPVLMALGFLAALAGPGIALNPWWGVTPATPLGVPILNAQLIGFAAPAALLLLAANRQYDHQRTAARLYAGGGGLFALMWAMLEVRRAFHFPYMAYDAIVLLEGACYGLLGLAGALAVAITARIRAAKDATRPFTHDLQLITRGCAWAGVLAAVWFLLVIRHPWWGTQNDSETTTLTTGLAVLAQAAAVALALVLGRALSNSMAVIRTRFLAASAAVVFAWSFGHCAIRWFHQFGAMDDGTGLVGLEGFGHAIWPLLLVVIGSEITARAPGRDTVRAYLYDLQAIWSSAVWPAAGFAALGLWLFFNPWWGIAPPPVPNLVTALIVLATFVFAAWLTMFSTGTPFLRWPRRFERAAKIAAIAHLFDGVTFAVRWAYHGADMAHAPTTDAEMWTYSAVWAVFAAGAFWLGLKRNDAILRWAGLVILVATTIKVFLIDITGGIMIRVASTIGLGLVLLGIAWLARRFGAPTPPLGPDDMAKITPSARRERRRDRR